MSFAEDWIEYLKKGRYNIRRINLIVGKQDLNLYTEFGKDIIIGIRCDEIKNTPNTITIKLPVEGVMIDTEYLTFIINKDKDMRVYSRLLDLIGKEKDKITKEAKKRGYKVTEFSPSIIEIEGIRVKLLEPLYE
jgi:hypothetical protein